MKNGNNPYPSPLQRPVGAGFKPAPTNDARDENTPVIPAKAGASADGTSIQRGRAAGSDDDPPNIDVEAARKSMARMANIFADIAKHAEDSSLERCPYKNAQSHCTAKFGCDNQHFTKNPLNPPICTARDGDLNYRSAWHTD